MARQLILGLGAGHCGLELLADILGRQSSAHVTLRQPPLLSWQHTVGAPGIRERIARILASAPERYVGDVASFYLPYAEEAIDYDPTVRMACLQRPEEEVVAGFLAALDRRPRVAVDHWSARPVSPYERDPIWSRCYPKYDVPDREAGIRRYWAEYYETAASLARRFPEQFRVFDTNTLTSEAGVRELLSFCGFPWSDQLVITGQRPAPPVKPGPFPPPHPFPNPLDPRRCVILVPFTGFIHQDCEQALKELERRGYQVRRVGGYAAIDQGRNQMATDALIDGFEETLWIDADVVFHPDDVETLRRHSQPIVCGIYPQKGRRALACHVMPGTPAATFGKEGGLVELLYAGTGFLLVRREVYLTVQDRLALPMTNERFGHPMIPFFLPMIRPIEEGHWYLAEDYAFCQRARECGYHVYADTSVRLWHIGTYHYGWEDAGMDRPRFGTFKLNFDDRGEVEPPPAATSADPAVRELMDRHPWPDEKPRVPPPPIRNWLFPTTREVLEQTVPKDARVILELGSFLGRSTRFLADRAPGAIVVAIDHWRGSDDMADDPEVVAMLPRLYETFLAECWLYRDRILPIRRATIEGLREVAQAGLRPDVIFIDADHGHDAVVADLSCALELFPNARIVGDDWDWEGVRTAVREVCQERALRYETHGVGWRITPGAGLVVTRKTHSKELADAGGRSSMERS